MCNELNEYDLLRKRRIESQSLVPQPLASNTIIPGAHAS
jgi:hypothetical protein